jgi:hypothetical protein
LLFVIAVCREAWEVFTLFHIWHDHFQHLNIHGQKNYES